MLVEKYRPKKVEDVIGLKPLKFKIDQKIPHLLLYGPAGTGKTTLSKIIIKTLGSDVLSLNSSADRGIDMVRSSVKSFASTQSTDGNIKIAFLDEADGLTADAQNALRSMMETYASNCVFIMTCNDVSKIIEPLQSRCVMIEFGDVNTDDVVKRMQFICEQEKIPFEVEALKRIAERCGSDIRRAINRIEELKEGVTLDRVKAETKLASDILVVLSAGDFDSARKMYLEGKPEEELFLRDFYEVIMDSGEKEEIKRAAVHAIANCYRFLRQSAWKQILVEDMFLTIAEVM
jgi:replication factor C small subunit